RQLLSQPIERAAAQRAVKANVGALDEPAVEPLLEVERAHERAPRPEARLQIALQPLDHPFRLRIARLEKAPAKAELAAEGRERLRRPTLAGVQRPLAVPDQRLRQRAQLAQAVADPVQQIRRFLREHQGAGAGARVRQASDDDVAAPRLPAAIRDLTRPLPKI